MRFAKPGLLTLACSVAWLLWFVVWIFGVPVRSSWGAYAGALVIAGAAGWSSPRWGLAAWAPAVAAGGPLVVLRGLYRFLLERVAPGTHEHPEGWRLAVWLLAPALVAAGTALLAAKVSSGRQGRPA